MKRNINILSVIILLCAAMWPRPALAATVGPLFADEAAYWGANLAVRITEADLTESTTNTAQTITNLVNIAANSSLELVAMVLEAPFDTVSTNYTTSTLLKIGDSGDDDLYLTSTELNTDGSEVYIKFAPANGGTIVSTPTFTTLSLTGTVQNVPVVTNGTVASTFTAAALGKKVYSSTDDLRFVFTPSAEDALSSYTNGAIRIYFRRLAR